MRVVRSFSKCLSKWPPGPWIRTALRNACVRGERPSGSPAVRAECSCTSCGPPEGAGVGTSVSSSRCGQQRVPQRLWAAAACSVQRLGSPSRGRVTPEQPHTSPPYLIRAVRLSCVKCGVLHAVQLACLHDWEAQRHMVPVVAATGGKMLQQKEGKRRGSDGVGRLVLRHVSLWSLYRPKTLLSFPFSLLSNSDVRLHAGWAMQMLCSAMHMCNVSAGCKEYLGCASAGKADASLACLTTKPALPSLLPSPCRHQRNALPAANLPQDPIVFTYTIHDAVMSAATPAWARVSCTCMLVCSAVSAEQGAPPFDAVTQMWWSEERSALLPFPRSRDSCLRPNPGHHCCSSGRCRVPIKNAVVQKVTESNDSLCQGWHAASVDRHPRGKQRLRRPCVCVLGRGKEQYHVWHNGMHSPQHRSPGHVTPWLTDQSTMSQIDRMAMLQHPAHSLTCGGLSGALVHAWYAATYPGSLYIGMLDSYSPS